MDILIGIITGTVLGLLGRRIRGLGGLLIWIGGNSLSDVLRVIIMEGISSSNRPAYLMGKLTTLVGGVILTITGVGSELRGDEWTPRIGILVSLLMWSYLISKAGNRLLTIGCVLCINLLTIKVVRLEASNVILCLVISLYGISGLLESIRYLIKKRIDPDIEEEGETSIHDWSMNVGGGVFVGIMSSIFYGIPNSAMCRCIEEKDGKERELLKSSSEGISSGLSLVMVVNGAGSRSFSSALIDNMGNDFTPEVGVGLLLISLAVTYLCFELRKYKVEPNVWTKILLLIASIYIVISNLGVINGAAIIVGSLAIRRLLKLSKAPNELSLVGISSIPIVNLVGGL